MQQRVIKAIESLKRGTKHKFLASYTEEKKNRKCQITHIGNEKLYVTTDIKSGNVKQVLEAVVVLVAESCLTLCNPKNCSSPGSSVHGISQVGIPEQVAISFSRRYSDPGIKPTSPVLLLLLSCFSCVQLCATSQTAAHQALLSLGFSRQEHWRGLPFPSPIHKSER